MLWTDRRIGYTMKRLFTVCLLVCLLLPFGGAAPAASAQEEKAYQKDAGVVFELNAEEENIPTEETEAAADASVFPVTGDFSLVMVLVIAALAVGCVIFSMLKKRRA